MLPYERPPLSKSARSEPRHIRDEASYREADIDLSLGAHVVAIDVEAKRLVCDDETVLAYDKLLLATGARARGCSRA